MKDYKNLLAVAEANMVLVRCELAILEAQKVVYDGVDETLVVSEPLEDAKEDAQKALDNLLSKEKADKEVSGKTCEELAKVLEYAGYDSAVLDFFSHLLKRN